MENCEAHHGRGHARPLRHHDGSCCLANGSLRGFLQPCLLALLLQEPGHGYELMERLGTQFGFADVDPGLLYRTLRLLERDGFVESAWFTEGQGPARRSYRVTDEGSDYMRAWAAQLERMREEMDRFLVTYRSLMAVEREN